MKQVFVHLNKYYISDLCELIEKEIESRNKKGFELIDIQYSGLELNDGDAHAYLIFRKVDCKADLHDL